MNKKRCILSVGMASIALLSAVILFMIKSGYVLALNNDRMENKETGSLDDADVITDDSTVFESGYVVEPNNECIESTENMETGSLDDVDVIMDYSTVFESE